MPEQIPTTSQGRANFLFRRPKTLCIRHRWNAKKAKQLSTFSAASRLPNHSGQHPADGGPAAQPSRGLKQKRKQDFWSRFPNKPRDATVTYRS